MLLHMHTYLSLEIVPKNQLTVARVYVLGVNQMLVLNIKVYTVHVAL